MAKTKIGGQAVMEGVMMRGERSMALAVRDEAGVIRLEATRIPPKKAINKIPFLRGIANLINSLILGVGTTMRSAQVAGETEITEGDDQIAYYCLNKKPNEKIIIMSGDMDLSQLLADDIAIYNLHLKKFITNKNFKDYFGYSYENVMVKKVFTGDASDNIPNIKGLSEDGLYKLMPEIKDRKVTIEEVKERAQQMIDERKKEKKKPLQLHENIINGVSNKPYDGDFYEINRKIIDLSHPLLSKEAKETMDSMMYNVMDPEGRSFGNLYRMILADNITEWMGDTKFASFFNLFKRLEIKERKRFEEFQKNQKK